MSVMSAVWTRRRGRRGFSLIELLVVIGVIAVVVAILLPTMSKARNAARRTVCVSQLQQIGMAVASYGVEYGGKWPFYTRPDAADRDPPTVTILYETTTPEGTVSPRLAAIGKLAPYLGNRMVFVCPNDYEGVAPFVERFDWTLKTSQPNSLYGTYCTRGWAQSAESTKGREVPGRLLRYAGNRAIVACHFMYHPGSDGDRLSLHKPYQYPVLFGGGDVNIGSLPKSMSVNPAPDVWSLPAVQQKIWDSFDRARDGGRGD